MLASISHRLQLRFPTRRKAFLLPHRVMAQSPDPANF
jgi:hypothetical protein